LAQFLEHFGEHQFLALHAAEITHFVVPVAEETFKLITFEPLHAGVEIDGEALAVVHVNHSFGHIDVHASEGIAQPFHSL